MKNETLNAMIEYILEVNKSIRYVASLGVGTDLGPLAEKTAKLWDCLQNEQASDFHQSTGGQLK